MAIHCNPAGFQVIFTQKYMGQEFHTMVIDYYCGDLDYFEKEDMVYIELKENIELSLCFQSSNPKTRLYMDGLEALSERLLEFDERDGEVYLLPSNQSITLYSSTQMDYPLIPGLYRIIVEHGGERYYSLFKIIPKQVDESQLFVMKKEVDDLLKGLARDVIRQKSGVNVNVFGIPQPLMGQFGLIKKRYSAIMAAISDLYVKANYQITTDYELIQSGKPCVLDQRAQKRLTTRQANQFLRYAPKRTFKYDLPENQLVKKIISFISKILSDVIESIEKVRVENHTKTGRIFVGKTDLNRVEIERRQFLETAYKMRTSFQWIMTAQWYEEIGNFHGTIIPPIMSSDPRYRTFYLLYKDLVKNSFEPSVDLSYSFKWKRTDKLYEIWGFGQLIKVLTSDKSGYVATNGWLFGDQLTDTESFVPSLPSGTIVQLCKREIKLHLVYEERLPSQSKLTSIDKPLYTRGVHTCPDARIDMFIEDLYVGSIVIDFKYRPKNAIWDQTFIVSNKQTVTMKQMISYGDNLHSTCLFGESSQPLFKQISPIQEVWAIFPNRHGQTRIQEHPDHKLSLIELTPGVTNAHFLAKIENSLEALINRSQAIIALTKKIKIFQ